MEKAIILLTKELDGITKKYHQSEEMLQKLIKVHELQEQYTSSLESSKNLS